MQYVALTLSQHDAGAPIESLDDFTPLPCPGSGSNMPVPRAILEQIKKLIPPLDGSLHKGQSGMENPSFATPTEADVGQDVSVSLEGQWSG
jgi:hypothetical protein